MLAELSVVEQRYHAVMEVLAGGVPVSEVAGTLGDRAVARPLVTPSGHAGRDRLTLAR
jgi:hypothetical protein